MRVLFLIAKNLPGVIIISLDSVKTERTALQLRDAIIDDQGIFTGYASVWGVVDSDGDVVERGAFARTLASGAAKGGITLLALHEDKMLPVGKTLEIREDDHGLWIKGYISPTSVGTDIRQLVKDGILTGLSIGYKAIKHSIDIKGIRHLTDVELYEISLVTWPSNPAATIRDYSCGTPDGVWRD